MNRNLFTATCLGLVLFAGTALAEAPLWQQEGFNQPESVLFDAERGRTIVSNVNGGPAELNGKGYLSLIEPDTGKIIREKWAVGLDAPKGLAIVGKEVLAADVKQLRIIDIETGKLIKTFSPKDSKFFNDIASDGKTAYVGDFMGNAIWRYSDGKFKKWVENEKLNLPNGLLVDGDRLIVAGWGVGVHEDFTTDEKGSLVQVDLKSGAITPVKGGEKLGNLDGLAKLGDTIFVSDWMAGTIHTLKPGDKAKLFKTYNKGLGDISLKGDMLYLPFWLDNKVAAIKVAE